MKRFSLLLPLILSLISCASRPKSSLNPVYITNSKSITLLSPQYAENSVEGLQAFTGTFSQKEFSAQAYFQSDKSGISIVLLNDFGVQMGQLDYTENYINFSSSYFPKSVKAEYFIADIQNVYYDFSALKENYFKSGLKFTELTSLDGIRIRNIYDGSTLIESIRIGSKSVIIKNFLRGYSYTLTGI